MKEAQLWYLEHIDLRNIFCPTKIDLSMPGKRHLDFPSNIYIYLPHEPAQSVYLINEGRIKIGSYSHDGKEITKAILGPGEVFGEMAVMGLENRRDFAYAMSPTKLCTLDRTDMSILLRERNELQLFFMQMLGKRTLQLEKRLENLVFKSSKTRILEFLIELTEHKGRAVGLEHEVRQMLTHKEIADLTATSRQSVNAILNELREENIISFNRKRMLVRDLARLQSLLVEK